MGKDKRENKRRTSARLEENKRTSARVPPIKKPEKETMGIHLGSNVETNASLMKESFIEVDYSGTKSKDDSRPTKEPKNSEGKKVLTENTPNFPAATRRTSVVVNARLTARLARGAANTARFCASCARDRAYTALCIDKANAARAAADAADAAAVVAVDAADAVDTATDCVATGIAAISHTGAVDDFEAANTLYNNHPGYFAALSTALEDASAANRAACAAGDEADAAMCAITAASMRTLKK